MHLQLKESCLWIWSPIRKALMMKRIIKQFVEWPVMIVIIRQDHRGSFSDPILSSGCSCVKPMLALLASNVASDVVFTSKKEWCFGWWRWCFALSWHGWLCFSMFSSCFHIFSHRSTSWSSPCYDVFYPKGVQLQLDGWPWNGEGVEGCAGSTVLEVFQPRQGWMLTSKKQYIKSILGQDRFLFVVS